MRHGRACRWAALLCGGIVLLAALLPACMAQHECTGEQCGVCLLCAEWRRLFTVQPAMMLSVWSVLLLLMRRIGGAVGREGSRYPTLVALRVKLSD